MTITFSQFVSMLPSSDKFKITFDNELNVVVVSDKDNEFSSVRIELSEFNYPFFFTWNTTKRIYEYNKALAIVLSKAISESNYINEISISIKKITNHRVYLEGTNDNLKYKDQNSYIFVDEDFNQNCNITDEAIRNELGKYPIQPASEKSIGDGIFVLSKTSLYSGIGYHFENGLYRSIFPNKSNLPARLKSFLLPNSVKLVNPSINIFKNGDKNTSERLVVFVKPGKERHVSGEIWIKRNNTTFTTLKREWYSETNLEIGKTYKPKDVILKSPFKDNHSYGNAKSIKCVDKNPFYVKIVVEYYLNESRVTSNTGLKGYSCIKEDIGKLMIDTTLDGSFGFDIVPDMIAGPSSTKGKVNQIKLAQAAYVAKYKYDITEPDSIDSMDENLINNLASEILPAIWISPDGEEVECYYGLVNVAYTDPSIQYSKNGPMGFQFEMTKLCMSEYPDLADAILSSRNVDDMKLVEEIVYLQESLNGKVNIPNLRTISFTSVNNSSIKSINIGRISSIEILPVENYLIKPDREPFFYKMKNGKKIYIPSGKSLSSFQSLGANGQWLYDVLLVQLSRIFSYNFSNLDGLKNAVDKYILSIGNRTVLYPQLYGVNMKQTTLYNHTMTVSIPSKNLKEAKRKIYKDTNPDDWMNQELYGIMVRNPA